MDSINKLLDYKRLGYAVIAFAVLFATVLPSLAFAAQVTERSIALSTSGADAEDVSYEVNFTPATSAGAVVIDFCNNSPALGATCTPPVGLNVAAAVGSGGFTVNGTPTANKIVLAGTITAPTPVSFDITNIDNPTAAGSMYARIVTFDDTTNAQAYTSASTTSATGYRDNGSVAMYITPNIVVQGSVRETLIFCASAAAIAADCGGSLTAPNVTLGTAGILDTPLSEGTVYSQISTNAASGAVVNLKSSTIGCGGLMRAGETDPALGCGIGPVNGTAAAIETGDSKFGVRFTGLDNGTGAVALAGGYDLDDFFMNYVTGDATGVTSTYGDPIYNTSDEPISNGEANLVFGANIGNDTPAGTYSATLNLIATGKF